MVVKEEGNNSGGIKYRCKKCGHIFWGNAYTNQCPIDYSFDIEEYNGDVPPPEEEKPESHKKEPPQPPKPPETPPDPWQPKWKVIKAWILKHRKALIITAVILLAVEAAVFLLFYCGKTNAPDITVWMDYEDRAKRLSFEVKGVDLDVLKSDYCICVVYNDIKESILFEDKNIIYYENMLDDQWYNFSLERIDNDTIKKLKWMERNVESNRYQLEVKDNLGSFYLKVDEFPLQLPGPDTSKYEYLHFPSLICNKKIIRDRNKYEITIEAEETDMSVYTDLRFEVEGKEYDSNPFYIDAPSESKEIEIKVSASNVENTFSFTKNIEPIEKEPLVISKLKMDEVQNILDKVSRKELESDKAYNMLAGGSVKLKKHIDNGSIKTLLDVLMDIDDYGTKFIVVSFDTDDNGKIKSGTLVVEKK